MTAKRLLIVAIAVGVAALSACSIQQELAPHLRPLSKDTMMLLGKKGMTADAPIFIRIFKEESELEVWKARSDGHYYHFKTYPICNWSGELGPKLVQGDKQAPEGFYTINKWQMKPDSSFYLAFNLGYPNNYDRSHSRTGSSLMVHGKCVSAGCYAMTDALIEEIYALAREHFSGGHENFPVHAFPFRMTGENMARYEKHKWSSFWKTLKEGYDYFEVNRQVPPVTICERRYHVNARPIVPVSTRIDPQGRCPRLEQPMATPFSPAAGKDQIAEMRVTAPGRKMRAQTASATPTATGSTEPGWFAGLTKVPVISGFIGRN